MSPPRRPRRPRYQHVLSIPARMADTQTHAPRALRQVRAPQINSETDFAAGSRQFVALAAAVAEAVAGTPAVRASAADSLCAVPVDEILAYGQDACPL